MVFYLLVQFFSDKAQMSSEEKTEFILFSAINYVISATYMYFAQITIGELPCVADFSRGLLRVLPPEGRLTRKISKCQTLSS